MTIREMCKRAQEGSIAKGFAVAGQMPNIDQKLVLAIGELVEAQNELRNGMSPAEVYINDPSGPVSIGYPFLFFEQNPKNKPEGFLIELADAVIRIGQLAQAIVDANGGTRIDLQDAIAIKMDYNATRPYLHGKRF